MAEIRINRKDADRADVSIESGGHVRIGKISAAEKADDGGHGGNITVQAASIDVGRISAYSARNKQDPNADPKNAGDVVLEALGFPDFDSDSAEANSLQNTITLRGRIKTAGPGSDLSGGDVTIRAVKVALEEDFSAQLNEGAELTIEAGQTTGTASEGELFVNRTSKEEFTAEHTIKWAGTIASPVPTGEEVSAKKGEQVGAKKEEASDEESQPAEADEDQKSTSSDSEIDPPTGRRGRRRRRGR